MIISKHLLFVNGFSVILQEFKNRDETAYITARNIFLLLPYECAGERHGTLCAFPHAR